MARKHDNILHLPFSPLHNKLEKGRDKVSEVKEEDGEKIQGERALIEADKRARSEEGVDVVAAAAAAEEEEEEEEEEEKVCLINGENKGGLRCFLFPSFFCFLGHAGFSFGGGSY